MKIASADIYEIGMPKNQTLERIYRLFLPLDFLKVKKTVDMLNGFDKIICHQYPMTYIANKAKKKYGKKINYIYHNAGVATPSLFSNPIEKIYMHLFTYLTNQTVKEADGAISISRYLADVLKKETGLDSSIEYVKIDKKRFHLGIDGKKIRQKYKIGNSPVCLYVGRISPHKGIHL
jgi:1,2-diacylglycerol 3-alpha-glucosyltransferase